MKHKLAIFSGNPVQYHAPVFKGIAKSNKIDLTVLYGDKIGLEGFYNPELRSVIKWDFPLLEGYKSIFFKNFAFKKRGTFFSRINFGIFFHVMFNNYDAVLIQGYDTFSSFLVFFAAKISFKKVILRGEAVKRPNVRQSKLNLFIKKIVLPTYFKFIDAILFSCSGNKKYFLQFTNCDKKFFSFPCAVDNDFFQKQSKKFLKNKNEIRNELGFSEDDFVIIFPARFITRKRPLDLIKAVNISKNMKLKLLFMGDGPLRDEMEKMVEELNIGAYFTGFVNASEISKYYSCADVVAVVSDYDASPKALNEAMNFSLPCIATRTVGTATDLINQGENGYVVEPFDIEDLSKKINLLSQNKKLFKKMQNHSKEIIKDWSIENDVKGIENALNYIFNES